MLIMMINVMTDDDDDADGEVAVSVVFHSLQN